MNTQHIFRNQNNTEVIAEVLYSVYPEADPKYDLCICQYTGALIPRNESITLGAVIPQAPKSYVCHPLASEARNKSVVDFRDSEQNCNTCKHLTRAKHERNTVGILYGSCSNPLKQMLEHPYKDRIVDDVFPFAPDDYMGMSCFESRRTK